MRRLLLATLSTTEGSQIVEFAIALPLLVVLVVGIFDFGTAFNLKQRVVNAAAVGARVASNQPTTDLATAGACAAPASVCAVRDAVDNALVTSKVTDCGLSTTNATVTGNLSWIFTPGGCAPGVMTLQVERGVTYTAALPNPPFQPNYTIEATRVTLIYPYKWTFNFTSVAKLINPSANYPSTSQLQSVAVMQNLN